MRDRAPAPRSLGVKGGRLGRLRAHDQALQRKRNANSHHCLFASGNLSSANALVVR